MKIKSEAELLGVRTAFRFGALISVVGVVLLVSWYLGTAESAEELYQRTTSDEVKTQHVAMAERLKTATRGDFVIQMDKSNRQIPRVVANDPGKQEESWRINLETADWSGVSSYNADSLARNVIRIVRKTDSDWAEVAKKFFEQ